VKVERLAIPDVVLITTKKFGDARGFFSETWNEAAFRAAGIDAHFVQDNHAYSATKDTLRGLHFQAAPMAQDKLLRVSRGAIFDVAVDIRKGSPSFGQHVSAVLSADNWAQLWVPKGFAHGYCSLEPDTEVLYKVTAPYAPSHDRGIRWDDPALAIAWPVTAAAAQLSDKDKVHPLLKDAPDLMTL
jgi:dTDP-4-dehydrorhamnose 3,5-epimerase